MGKTVWKWEKLFAETMVIQMPVGAIVRHVTVNEATEAWGQTFTVWAEVDSDPDVPTVPREFHVVGTGHSIPEVGDFIASVISGIFVWHIYEGVRR